MKCKAANEGIPKQHGVIVSAVQVIVPIPKDLRGSGCSFTFIDTPQYGKGLDEIRNLLANLDVDATASRNVPLVVAVIQALPHFDHNVLNSGLIERNVDHPRREIYPARRPNAACLENLADLLLGLWLLCSTFQIGKYFIAHCLVLDSDQRVIGLVEVSLIGLIFVIASFVSWHCPQLLTKLSPQLLGKELLGRDVINSLLIIGIAGLAENRFTA
jgi:hypothetical protein